MRQNVTLIIGQIKLFVCSTFTHRDN